MAIDGTPEEEPRQVLTGVGPARHLRSLRVETQYRNETRNLSRLEREKYGNFLWNLMRLNLGPRVSIADLVGEDQESQIAYEDEQSLISSVTFYHQRGDSTELIRVLKFYSAYLMQQARKEDEPAKQEYLLYKAIDMARMIVQYSPMSANGDAEALVFGIFIALGTDQPGRYANVMEQERKILEQMRRLERSPQDIQLRMAVADELVDQRSHLDGLVQYHMLLRLLVRRGASSNRSRSWVVSRIGDLFQDLSALSASQLRDGRKLRNFIDRFNRDFATRGHTLPALTALTTSQVNRVRRAFLAEANRWYLQSISAPLLERRRRARITSQVGENYLEQGEPARALRVLEEGFVLWSGLEESEPVLREKVEYLRHATTAAMQAKDQQRLNWGNREAAAVNNKLSAIERAKRDKEAVRAAMMA